MVKNKTKIELLAPASNFKMLQAAINAGCDAVYFGLQEFNMRALARNFQFKDLKQIKKICKDERLKQGKKEIKCYLTLNTIIYNNELKKLDKLISKVKPYVNAIICWDIATIQLCKKHKIEFHISTQASISNIETAKFYKKLGATRVILARELSLKQIKEISKIINTEVFAHGAMCVSISGRCFTSQFLFNKSANRGQCIHPCRRFYNVKDNEGNELKVKNNYIFSAKDLCTLPFIEKIKKSGVVSIKIEGRNRDVEYVDTVVKIYRYALDNKITKQKSDKLIKQLKKVYNKGFSSGFYLGVPTSDDFSKSEHSQATETKQIAGVVYHYYKKPKVALVKVSKKLKIGDEIYVSGNKTGVFRHKIKSMEINHKPVDFVEKNKQVGIKMPLCRKNDQVYIIKNKVL